MATPLSRTAAQAGHTLRLDEVCALRTPTTYSWLGRNSEHALLGLSECGRLAQDIVLGALCGITIGVAVAAAAGSF
jgi:hypothetical protein